MLIDCDACAVRGPGCPDCVVTAILNITDRPVELDPSESDAMHSLAEAGLLPPLRLVPRFSPSRDIA
jgi:hypothetical protein